MSIFDYINSQPTSRQFIGIGEISIHNTVDNIHKIISSSAFNPYVRKWAEKIIVDIAPGSQSQKDEASAIQNFVKYKVRYTKDPRGLEYIQTPPLLLKLIEKGEVPMGDCVTGDTVIIVENKETNLYELKTIKSLEWCYEKYNAISYDFENKKWVFKPIIGFAHKGEQEINLVKFDNGSFVKCTDGHKFFNAILNSSNIMSIKPTRIEDIKWNLLGKQKSFYNKICCAYKLPTKDIVSSFNKEELWLQGMYVAEGSIDKHSICQDKIDVRNEIEEKFASLSHAVIWNRLESGETYIPKHLWPSFTNLGTTCDRKHFLSEHLSMDKDNIKIFLDGYTKGDDHIPQENSSWYNKIHKMYVTTSYELANQLSFLHLLLGSPIWKTQIKKQHMGKYSKKPAWRMYERTGKQGYRNEKLNGMALTSITSVEKIGVADVYDIEVKDTHNFVTADGIILHNCDDMTTLSLSLLKSIGYPVATKIASYRPDGKYSHIYGLVFINNQWYPIDCVKREMSFGWEAPGATVTIEKEVI